MCEGFEKVDDVVLLRDLLLFGVFEEGLDYEADEVVLAEGLDA
jgi:hypothetical protein